MHRGTAAACGPGVIKYQTVSNWIRTNSATNVNQLFKIMVGWNKVKFFKFKCDLTSPCKDEGYQFWLRCQPKIKTEGGNPHASNWRILKHKLVRLDRAEELSLLRSISALHLEVEGSWEYPSTWLYLLAQPGQAAPAHSTSPGHHLLDDEWTAVILSHLKPSKGAC